MHRKFHARRRFGELWGSKCLVQVANDECSNTVLKSDSASPGLAGPATALVKKVIYYKTVHLLLRFRRGIYCDGFQFVVQSEIPFDGRRSFGLYDDCSSSARCLEFWMMRDIRASVALWFRGFAESTSVGFISRQDKEGCPALPIGSDPQYPRTCSCITFISMRSQETLTSSQRIC